MANANDRQLAHNLRVLVTTLNRNLRKQLGNPEQLSFAEENVVSILLGQREALPSELCQQLNISSQFMSQILNRLEDLEYISRKVSRTDKRKSLVTLSKRGLVIMQQRRKQKEDLLTSMICRRFNNQEKKQIAQAIDLLAQLYESR
jgi:DNA-binding MarR family transcriptional regulator